MANTSNKEKILTIVTAGLCVALSVVLSEVKLFEMPMGGSVTAASCLPLIVFAMAFGPVWGLIASVVFAIIQVVLGMEWFVTPFQMFLDYGLGYASLGIAGFAALKSEDRLKIRNPIKRFARAGLGKAIVFSVIAYIVRWFCSVLSGVIFYAEYAPEGMNPWVYSMTYNGSFMAVDLAVCIAVMVALFFVIGSATNKSKNS